MDKNILYESQVCPMRELILIALFSSSPFSRIRTRAVNHHKAPSLQFRVLLGHKELTSFSHLDIVSNHIAFYFLWNVNSIKITILFLFLRSFNNTSCHFERFPKDTLWGRYSFINEHSKCMQSIGRAGGGNKRWLGQRKKLGVNQDNIFISISL